MALASVFLHASLFYIELICLYEVFKLVYIYIYIYMKTICIYNYIYTVFDCLSCNWLGQTASAFGQILQWSCSALPEKRRKAVFVGITSYLLAPRWGGEGVIMCHGCRSFIANSLLPFL